MADTKISALAAVAAVVGAQEFAVNDAGASKKATATQVQTFLGVLKSALSADYTNATTTGTKVVGLSITLPVGTYRFSYHLLFRSNTLTVGGKFGINFTGTQTAVAFMERWIGTGSAASTGTIDDQNTGAGAEQIEEGSANRVLSTTAPNLDVMTGVATVDVDNFVIIEGVIVVSVAGDIELWAAAEAAGTISLMTGSNLVVTRF